jgi:hypothetical protein
LNSWVRRKAKDLGAATYSAFEWLSQRVTCRLNGMKRQIMAKQAAVFIISGRRLSDPLLHFFLIGLTHSVLPPHP